VVKEHAGPDRVLPLQTFRSIGDYEQLANLVWERLESHVGPEVLSALYETLQEVGANVIEHSQATRGGYIAAQVYRRSTPNEYVLLAIGDVVLASGSRCLSGTRPHRTGKLWDLQSLQTSVLLANRAAAKASPVRQNW